jgi:hypothetical protein
VIFGVSGLRMTSGARQMTSRSPSEARSLFPPSQVSLRGRGGERPFSKWESAGRGASSRERAEGHLTTLGLSRNFI